MDIKNIAQMFYSGDYAGGLPTGIQGLKAGDEARDTSTGTVWEYSGLKWVRRASTAAEKIYLSNASSLQGMIDSEDSEIPENLHVYTGVSTSIPPELRNNDRSLVINHGLGSTPKFFCTSKDTLSDVWIDIIPEDGEIITTGGGDWSCWLNFYDRIAGSKVQITVVDFATQNAADVLSDNTVGSVNDVMFKSVYDTNDNGIVDAAESVAWSGVTGKPELLINPPGGTVGQYLKFLGGTSTEWSTVVAGVTSVNGSTGDVIISVNGKTTSNINLTASDVGALSISGGTVTGNLTVRGNVFSTGNAVSTITATGGTVTIPAETGHIYIYNAVAGDIFVFTTPPSGDCPEFELDIRQPATAVSFTLPIGIQWRFGTPDLSTAGKLYQLKFRYLNNVWEGWTTPEMSEYAKLNGDNTWTGINTYDKNGKEVKISYAGVAVGLGAVIADSSSLAVGYCARANGYYSIALGYAVKTYKEGELCIGYISSNESDHTNYSLVICKGNSNRGEVGFKYAEGDLYVSGNLTIGGSITSGGQKLTSLTSTSIQSIPSVSGVTYTYTPTGSEIITFANPTSGYTPTFELWLTMPATVVSFSFGNTILWSDGNGRFSQYNPAPTFSEASAVYRLAFQYDGNDWLGNLVSLKEL